MIRLYLYGTDRASVHRAARGDHSFIPFEGLRRHERYAEVLGHELTHACLMLENPAYLRMIGERDRRLAQFHAARRDGSLALAAETTIQQEEEWFGSIIEQIERPAFEAEHQIWRELLGDREAR